MTWLLVTRQPQWLSTSACEPRFPGIHIAQFRYQVIRNCGLIYLLHRSREGRIEELNRGIGAGHAGEFAARCNVPQVILVARGGDCQKRGSRSANSVFGTMTW